MSVEFDRGAGIVLYAGPFGEADAGEGAIGEEGWFVRVLLDSWLV